MKLWLTGAIPVLLLLPLVSFGFEFRAGEIPSTNTDETFDDMYIAGGNVSSAGTIEGDLIAGGGSVLVSGSVGVDATVSGGNVSVTAPVGDDLRIAGGNVLVQSTIGDDLLAAGGQLTITGDGIGGDAALAGGMVRLDAAVDGDVRVAGGEIYLNAPIAGDVIVEAERLTLGSQANITGNLAYKANTVLTQEDGAVVQGQTLFEERTAAAHANVPTGAMVASAVAAFLVGKFLALLASALVIGLVFRRFAQTLVHNASRKTLPSLGLGLVMAIVLPVVSVILLVTLIGIPLGLLGLIGTAALALVTYIMAPIILGSLVANYFSATQDAVTWKTILLGVFLYTIIGLVPVLGWLAQATLVLIALGALTMLKWQIAKEWR